MKKIWCVEDDASIRDILLYTLHSTGFESRGFEEAGAFWSALKNEQPDLILLDIMLPGSDGMSILKALRQHPQWKSIPVIMTTAKGMESDKIVALDRGADDYLVKPFGMMEMIARIKAVLRRCEPKPDEPEVQEHLVLGPFELDRIAHMAWLWHEDGTKEILDLTRKEFALLELFMTHPGKAFSRDDLLMRVWKTDFAGETRTVDVHIRALRTKLQEAGTRIETVRGIGYRMDGSR